MQNERRDSELKANAAFEIPMQADKTISMEMVGAEMTRNPALVLQQAFNPRIILERVLEGFLGCQCMRSYTSLHVQDWAT